MFIWLLEVAMGKKKRKRTLREVVGGGISRIGRKVGGGRSRYKEAGSRFLTPEMGH